MAWQPHTLQMRALRGYVTYLRPQPSPGSEPEPESCWLLACCCPSFPTCLMSLNAHYWLPGRDPLKHGKISELEGASENISLNPVKTWELFKVENKGEIGGPRPSLPDWILCHWHFGNHSRSSELMILRVPVQVTATGPSLTETCVLHASFHSLHFSGPRALLCSLEGWMGQMVHRLFQTKDTALWWLWIQCGIEVRRLLP